MWCWITVPFLNFIINSFLTTRRPWSSSLYFCEVTFCCWDSESNSTCVFSQSPAPVIELPVSILCFDSRGDGCIWSWNIWAVCFFFFSNNHSLESVLKHVFQEVCECFLSLHKITSDLNDERASCSSQRLDLCLLMLFVLDVNLCCLLSHFLCFTFLGTGIDCIPTAIHCYAYELCLLLCLFFLHRGLLLHNIFPRILA